MERITAKREPRQPMALLENDNVHVQGILKFAAIRDPHTSSSIRRYCDNKLKADVKIQGDN